MRLRSHVLIIAAATFVPIIAIVCVAVVLLFQKGRDIELDHLVDTARALSLAVDKDFETGLASLRTLATNEHLRTGDLRTFYDESKRVLAVLAGAEAIVLVDPSGQQIMNTRRPFGEALPQSGDPGFIKKVVESGRPTVSNLFIGRISQRPVISVGVPVVLDGQVKSALTLSLSTGSLQQLLVQQGIAAGSVAAIIDANKITVARTREIEKYLGKPAPPTATAKSAETMEGWWLGVPYGGEPSYVAHRRSELSGWSVFIAVPGSIINAPLWQALQFVVGGIFLFLLMALGLATVFGRRITSSIAALAAGAKAVGSGESMAIMPSPVFELDQVRRELESASTKRKEMEASVRQSEERLRAIIDTEPECVKVVSPDGKLVDMNAAGLRMLQADSLAAIGDRSFVDFVLPNYREAFGHLHRRVMSGESGTLEFEIAGLKGRQLWLETHTVPLRDAAGRVTALLGVARDITERKFAEEQLRYELQLIRNITDSASECIFIADENGNVTFANPEAGKTFGYELDELMGQSLHETLHHSYADGRPFPKSDCVLGRTRVSGSTIRNHEDVFFRKDGSPVIVECSNAPVEIDGKRIGAVLIARDVAERKRAEEALRAAHDELELRVEERTAELTKSNALLREKDEHLTLAQRAGHTGLWSRDLVTGKSSMSPEWHELMGFPIAETPVSFAEFLDRVHPDDRERVKEMSLHQKIGDFDREFRIVHPVKGERWIFSRGRRGNSTADGHLHMMGALIDITERKQTEEALRRSEVRLRHALTVGSMGLWERDLRTGKVQWDRQNYEIFGIEAETSVDLETFLSRVHPDDLPVVKSALERTQSTGADYVCEFRVLKPDGKIIWLHANGGFRRDGGGTPTHIGGINFDITERKVAETALRDLNEQLDQRVAQRTQELAESQARLRALVAELTKAEERERRRIAVELHDYLAQSLTAIRMNLSRADKFITGPERNDDLKTIWYEVESALNNSINYTRSLIGELSPRVLYDLGLPAALGWLGEQMGRHGLTVEVDGPPDSFSLAEDDAVFLFQCARELLWNVVKHGETNRATITYGRDGNRVSLAVVDNGKGFDPQAAHANGNGGTHFGLFSIRERVELRGGQVEIDSAPGVGTWVTIILSVDQSEEVLTKMVKPDVQQSALGVAIKIVIVDDHKMVRQGLRRVLEEYDDLTIVGEAGDGAEAVAMARELEPDVVIMDVNLPTMSGIDATQGIIRDRPSTIVIGLSFGSDSYVSQAMQAAGAVTCIAKERAVEDVRQAIMDAVEGRRVVTAH